MVAASGRGSLRLRADPRRPAASCCDPAAFSYTVGRLPGIASEEIEHVSLEGHVMVASIKTHRDEIGLTDGELLIDGSWGPGSAEQAWTHSHPATGEDVASFPVASADDVD